MRKLLSIVLGLAVFIGISVTSANAKTLKCQTVLNTKADEVKMLKDFTDTVTTPVSYTHLTLPTICSV